MMSAIEIIQTICPQLADSPSLSQYVQVATESLNSRFFGKLFNQAVAYKACHLFTLNKASPLDDVLSVGGGPVTGISEGGISVNFADIKSDNELNATKYGRQLLGLMKSRPRMDVNRNYMPPLPQYPFI